MIDIIKNIAIQAGQIALKYYNSEFDIKTKSDNSPVTEADLAVNDYICKNLINKYPDIAILSEEYVNGEKELKSLLNKKKIFIIDPIDGTEAFIEKRPEFTINIGYVENNEFTLGAVYVPRLDILYYNDDKNAYKVINAYKNPVEKLLAKKNNEASPKINIATISHRTHEIKQIESELKKLNIKIKKFIKLSSSYKFCLVADGSADIYLRRGNTKIWDIAASMPILSKTGNIMVDCDKKVLNFNNLKNYSVIPFFDVISY